MRIDQEILTHMKIPDVHIERIRGLGYTESEARFLYIVAVFSGYFTLKQFRAFTGASYGKRPSCFAEKLIEQGHARICGQARGGSLFHLFSRTIYGQMEKDNLRNRKRHSLGFIRTRLVLLDFVLGNQDLAYFETEQDKVNFFCQELGISKEYLPANVYEGAAPDQKTIRYFVDKFPLFVAPPFPGLPPVVTFSYVDAGFERPSQFASHLAAYQPLFRQLNPTSTVFRVGGFVFYCLRFFSSLPVLTCQALCRSNADCSLCANTSQSSAGAGSRLPSEQIVRCRGPLAVWTDSTRR